GAGLCEACNHTKELPGWTARPRPGPRHTLETTTPTGHNYQSTAPPLPGTTVREREPDLAVAKRPRHRGRRQRAKELLRTRGQSKFAA
ncbi:MAG TPA: HNH endonuclease, partial [Arthrobacter sp.]|nr:HNH endonuclease [Arthrobacter sp.]